MPEPAPLVGIIMGSKSDWDTMRHAAEMLDAVRRAPRIESRLGAPHAVADGRIRVDRGEARARRSSLPALVERRICPGWSRRTRSLPVIGVPVQSAALSGLDSLLSIVQMPKGVPVATVAIGAVGRRQRRPARGRHSRHVAAGAPREAAGVSRRDGRRSRPRVADVTISRRDRAPARGPEGRGSRRAEPRSFCR